MGEQARRGRRLSEERTEHILGTVLDVLYDVGSDQLRMQDVAGRACVGLSTIYRRWPTKQDLVRESLCCERAAQKFLVTDVFRKTAVARIHEHPKSRLAAELGDDCPDLDLRASTGPAILLYTAAISGQPIEPEAMAARLTDPMFTPCQH